MKTLDGKVVVITGAGSGIGRELAVQAAVQGAELALSDWDENGLVETARMAGERTHREVQRIRRTAPAGLVRSRNSRRSSRSIIFSSRPKRRSTLCQPSMKRSVESARSSIRSRVITGSRSYLPAVPERGRERSRRKSWIAPGRMSRSPWVTRFGG